MTANAQSPLLSYSEEKLIERFPGNASFPNPWMAFDLYGTDATQENGKAVAKKLMFKLHPDKCKLPGANDAYCKVVEYKEKLIKSPPYRPMSSGYTARAAPPPAARAASRAPSGGSSSGKAPAPAPTAPSASKPPAAPAWPAGEKCWPAAGASEARPCGRLPWAKAALLLATCATARHVLPWAHDIAVALGPPPPHARLP